MPFLQQLLHEGGLAWKVLQTVGLGERWPFHLGGLGGRQELWGRAQIVGRPPLSLFICSLSCSCISGGCMGGPQGWVTGTV